MTVDLMMKQAIERYAAGDKRQARKILAEILREEPDNMNAWLGTAMCLDDPDKKRYCLERALALKPDSERAKALLDQMDAERAASLAETRAIKLPASMNGAGASRSRLGLTCMLIAIVVVFCLLTVLSAAGLYWTMSRLP
jgi:hypothetical protein